MSTTRNFVILAKLSECGIAEVVKTVADDAELSQKWTPLWNDEGVVSLDASCGELEFVEDPDAFPLVTYTWEPLSFYDIDQRVEIYLHKPSGQHVISEQDYELAFD